MEIKSFLILISILLCSLIFAQEDHVLELPPVSRKLTSPIKLHLYSGETIGGYVEILKKGTYGKEIDIIVDNVIYYSDSVNFYSNHQGFYANTRYIRGNYFAPLFTTRIVKGKLNLYQNIRINYQKEPLLLSGNGKIKQLYDYYNFGLEDLKKVRYKNLASDLVDYPQCLKHISHYRKLRNRQLTLNIFGGLAAIGSILAVSNINPEMEESSWKIGPPLVLLSGSIVSFSISSHLSRKKREQVSKAAEVYNH